MMQHQPQPHHSTHANPQNGNGQQGQHTSPRSSLHHTEQADSDDAGHSGDDGENDYDDHNESTRQGKRKRPISVSYVHASYLASHLYLSISLVDLGRLAVPYLCFFCC